MNIGSVEAGFVLFCKNRQIFYSNQKKVLPSIFKREPYDQIVIRWS